MTGFSTLVAPAASPSLVAPTRRVGLRRGAKTLVRATKPSQNADPMDAMMAKREQREKEAAANAPAASSARAIEQEREQPEPLACAPGFLADLRALERAGVSVHALGERFLEDGSQGDDVKELQCFLQGTGHFTHKDGPTGYFGPATTAAVKQWQGKYGLPQSGGFGAQSRATYVLCKRAELRLTREMRSADPELAARRAKAAAEAGLVDPRTGLPVPPGMGAGRAGTEGVRWTPSAEPRAGVVGAADAAGAKLGLSGDAVLGAAVIVVGGYLFGLWRDERAHESERGGDWIAPEHPSWSAAGAEGKRDDRRPFDDVEVWHREDDQK
jgi:hypothetical protein